MHSRLLLLRPYQDYFGLIFKHWYNIQALLSVYVWQIRMFYCSFFHKELNPTWKIVHKKRLYKLQKGEICKACSVLKTNSHEYLDPVDI